MKDFIDNIKVNIRGGNSYSNKKLSDIKKNVAIPLQWSLGRVIDSLSDADSSMLPSNYKNIPISHNSVTNPPESGASTIGDLERDNISKPNDRVNAFNMTSQGTILAQKYSYTSDENGHPVVQTLTAQTYKPLLRGISDVPVENESVLLCEFGGVRYYLGPLNTQNSPNFNFDPLFDSTFGLSGLVDPNNIDANTLSNIGFPTGWNSTGPQAIKRLRKPKTPASNPRRKGAGGGDQILEGRYGNSIRIGAKNSEPYLMISNGRLIGSSSETLLDKSLFVMINKGDLSNWFDNKDEKNSIFQKHGGYEFSSNQGLKISSKRKLKYEENQFDGSQTFLMSDKVTIDSRWDNIILSSGMDINLGSVADVNMISGGDTLINSKQIFFGEKKFESGEIGVNKKAEHVAMADTLIDILTRMIDAIGTMNVGGVQPAGFSSPLSGGNTPGWGQLSSLKGELKKIKSEYVIAQRNKGEDTSDNPDARAKRTN